MMSVVGCTAASGDLLAAAPKWLAVMFITNPYQLMENQSIESHQGCEL